MKEANKKEWLQWCMSMLDQCTLPHDPIFIDMQKKHYPHLDQKWFNGTKNDTSFYFLPTECRPIQDNPKQDVIQKDMFLSAVCRTLFGDEGTCIFDGELGMWTMEFCKKGSTPFFHFSIHSFLKLTCLHILLLGTNKKDK